MATEGITIHLKAWKGIEDAVIEGLHEGGDILAAEIRRLATEEDKHGRMYDGHRASAPGEPYANWTGKTLSQVRVEKTADRVKVSLVGENAARLEHGTEKMEPRPILNPAYRNVQQKILEAAGFRVRRYTTGGAAPLP